MASAKFQIGIKDRGIKALFDRVARLAGRKLRNNFADLRPIVVESINEAVESNKAAFVPTPDEIGQLGIGEGGSPDLIAQVAFLALKPGHGNATTLSVRKKGTEKGSTIGEIRISIDEEAFYNEPDSVIETESDELPVIPWMKWLILGKTISDYDFTTQDPGGVSRTGRGIMVNGTLWSIEGRGSEIYGKIINDARLSVNRKLGENESVSILRRLRR